MTITPSSSSSAPSSTGNTGNTGRAPVRASWMELANVLAMLVCSLTLALVALNVHSPLRLWLALVSFTFGPGTGLASFLRLRDLPLQLSLVLGLSAAVDLLVAQILLWAHLLDATLAIFLVTAVCATGPIIGWNLSPPPEQQEGAQ